MAIVWHCLMDKEKMWGIGVLDDGDSVAWWDVGEVLQGDIIGG